MGRWHAAEGAHVVKGATLFEIETDKAAMEVDAPASGVLRFVAASEGDVLPVGACIGWIVAEGEDFVPPAPSPQPSPGGRGGAALPPESRFTRRERVAREPVEGRASYRTAFLAPNEALGRARRPPLDGSRASAACGSRT